MLVELMVICSSVEVCRRSQKYQRNYTVVHVLVLLTTVMYTATITATGKAGSSPATGLINAKDGSKCHHDMIFCKQNNFYHLTTVTKDQHHFSNR